MMKHSTHAQELIEVLRTACQDAIEELLEGVGTDFARIERAAEILTDALELEHEAYKAETEAQRSGDKNPPAWSALVGGV